MSINANPNNKNLKPISLGSGLFVELNDESYKELKKHNINAERIVPLNQQLAFEENKKKKD